MKTTTITILSLGLLSVSGAFGQTEQTEKAAAPAQGEPPQTMESALGEALFAEEVDRDLEKARRAYTEVLRQFTESRETAATAAYRLGEVYRKLADEEPGEDYQEKAARQYETVIRDFIDQESLVKLSREALQAMGRTPLEPGTANPENGEAQRIRQLKEWKKTSPDKLAEMPTPLYEAAAANQLRVAEHLIGSGVDLNRGIARTERFLTSEGVGQITRYETPLAAAAGAGHLAMVNLLLEAGADLRPEGSIPPFHAALRRDRMAVVKALLDAGAHLGVRDRNGNPPLIALTGDTLVDTSRRRVNLPVERRLEYSRLLLEAGTDIDERNDSGATALILAIGNGAGEMVDWLLEQGADVNAPRDQEGSTTPLILATQQGDVKLVKRLLDAGADVNQTDEKGITPLHYALNDQEPDSKIVELLLQSGADVNQRIGGEDGWTPLHVWAVIGRDHDTAKLLLRAGENPIAFARGVPKGLGFDDLEFSEGTPLSLIMDHKGPSDPVVTEFYEYALRSLSPDGFSDAVWFAMPRSARDRSHPRSDEAPTDLIPNLFPVFEREEIDSSPSNLASLVVSVFNYRNGDRKQLSPDFDAIRILRPDKSSTDSGNWKTHVISYQELIDANNPGEDPQLKWGDVVLFNQAKNQSTVPRTWSDRNEEVSAYLSHASRITANLKVGSLSGTIRVFPDSSYRSYWSSASVAGDYWSQNHVNWSFDKQDGRPGDLSGLGFSFVTKGREDLDGSSIRIRRGADGQSKEYAVDPETGEIHLQNSDEVTIPFKDGYDCMVPKDRKSHIWVARPGTYYLSKVAIRSDFEPRSVDGLPLSRIVVMSYSPRLLQFPFPDFDQLRIDLPGDHLNSGKLVSLKDDPDEMVPWGAILQIPIQDDADPKSWQGFSEEERAWLSELSRIRVTVEPEGMARREVDIEYALQKYERSLTGELKVYTGHRLERAPTFSIKSIFSDEIEGEADKWDPDHIILEPRDGAVIDPLPNSWPKFSLRFPLLDGDVIKFFKKL